jgi:hypothetical protein
VTAEWGALERSLMLKVEQVHTEATHRRGRAALAAAGEGGADRPALLAEAARCAHDLERRGTRLARPLGELLAAGVAAARGDAASALDRLGAATAGFAAAEMALHAAVARRRRGELVGGDEGRALVAAADAWMAGEKIKRPAGWAALLAPGFPG